MFKKNLKTIIFQKHLKFIAKSNLFPKQILKKQ